MQIYTVHAAREAADGPLPTLDERAAELVFVREGFSLSAFLLGPFWLAAHRLWLPLLSFIAVAFAIQGVFWLLPSSGAARIPVFVIAALGFGLEANAIRRWGLERRGYTLAGTAVGKTFDECEHRFLTHWIGTRLAAQSTQRPSAA